jgi:hypothetical protein
MLALVATARLCADGERFGVQRTTRWSGLVGHATLELGMSGQGGTPES